MAAITSIAAGVGIAATAATTGMSFAQASKQKKEQRKAESEAKRYLEEARKKLDVNFYDKLAVQKEAYELEREALLSAGAQSIEAGVESERGAAATAGRVQLAQQAGQRQIAAAMGEEMANLEKLSAAEDARLRDMQAELDLDTAAGAQKAAAIAEARSAQAMQQGMEGVVSLGQQVVSTLPLYAKSKSARQLGKISGAAQKGGFSQQEFQNQLAAFGKANPEFGNLAAVGGMDAIKFQDYMSQFKPEYLKKVGEQYNKILEANKAAQGLTQLGGL